MIFTAPQLRLSCPTFYDCFLPTKLSDKELADVFDHTYNDRRTANSSIRAFVGAKPPETLYHYTSVHGLKGIVERGEIWCTRTDFFNDASEIGYGLKQVEVAFKTIKTDQALAAYVNKIQGIVLKELTVYACCFCERGDLLNQWHGYGERGGGYSLGLSTSGLGSIICSGPHFLDRKTAFS